MEFGEFLRRIAILGRVGFGGTTLEVGILY